MNTHPPLAPRPSPLARDHRSPFTDDWPLLRGTPFAGSVRTSVRAGAVLMLALWIVVLPGRADVLIGTNGDRFTGKVIEETQVSVIFESELGGKITIPRPRIREIRRSPPPTTGDPLLITNKTPVSVAEVVSTTTARTTFTVPDLSWVPPLDRFDWIQLTSGEWLKGRIKAMQDRQLEFDSEKLNDLIFDWKDVRQVRSPRTIDVLFLKGEKVSGPMTITLEQVTVGGVVPRSHPRDTLQSLTPGGSKERDYWSGKASVGLTVRAGNTKSVDYSAQAHLQRRTPATRLSLDYIGNVSSVDDVESANNHRVNSEFDLWLSRRFYLVLPAAEYYKDPFQNLENRLTLGVGAGYDLVDRPNLTWNITAGPAYQQAWFESAQPGEPTAKGTGALTFGSRFDWEITRRIDLILEYRGQYTSRKVGETTHHSVSTLSLEMTKRLDLDVSLVWDRIAQPRGGASGIQPKPDDFRLVVGLGVGF